MNAGSQNRMPVYSVGDSAQTKSMAFARRQVAVSESFGMIQSVVLRIEKG